MSDIKHLTPEQIALTAEAINENRFGKVDADIRRHLTECDQCSSDVLMVADIAFDFKQGQKKQKTSDYPLKNSSFFYPLLTAAAVVGFGVVLFAFFMKPSSDIELAKNTLVPERNEQTTGEVQQTEENIQPFQADSQQKTSPLEEGKAEVENDDVLEKDNAEEQVQQANEQPVLLAQFTPHEDLEKLVNNSDSFYRGATVKIQMPSSIIWSDFDSLKWNNPENKNLIVEFFNNDNERILIENTTNQGISIPDLAPGLYYWKLIDKENFDLLFTGKITRKN